MLALAAAVVVPMLLESEPRPLGEDVAVRIPPVDDGKFVNRLNEPSTKTDARPGTARPESGTKSSATPGDTTAKAPAGAPPASGTNPTASETIGSGRPKYDTSLTPKDAPAGASGGSTSTAPGAAPAAGAAAPAPPPPTSPPPATAATAPAASSSIDGAKGAPGASAPTARSSSAPSSSSPAPAPASSGSAASTAATSKSAAPPSTPAPKADGGYAIQLAAFSDDKGANALAGRLKRAGYTAYTEPVKNAKGVTLYRVRVGPYASKDAAAAAHDKLKGEGQDGNVVPVH